MFGRNRFPSRHRRPLPGSIASPAACCILLLCITAASPAQRVEAGVWGGLGYTSLPHTQAVGVGCGINITYHLVPHFSARLAGGALFNAVETAPCRVLPSASKRTFHTFTYPTEVWLRFRTSGDIDSGSFNLIGGITGAYVTRDSAGVLCDPGGQRTIPGTSLFTLGAAGGIGFETARFIDGTGRMFCEYYFSWGISGADDDGRRIFYSSLRVGTSFSL